MKVCPEEDPLPTQPGPTAGWKWTGNGFGTNISAKKRPNRSRSSGWTVKSDFLGGCTLQQFRRQWLTHCAKAWKTSPHLNKQDFLDYASGYTIYNIEGTLINPTPWNVYMWTASPQWGWMVFQQYQNGNRNWLGMYLDCPQTQQTLDPPQIQAASIAADMSYSITINRPSGAGAYYLNLYASAPFQSAVHLPNLYAVRCYGPPPVGLWTLNVSSADMLDLFKPFPVGSNALVGARWYSGGDTFVSQAAAVMVEVGA